MTSLKIDGTEFCEIRVYLSPGGECINLELYNSPFDREYLASLKFEYDISRKRIKLFPPHDIRLKFNNESVKESCRQALREWIRDTDTHRKRFAFGTLVGTKEDLEKVRAEYESASGKVEKKAVGARPKNDSCAKSFSSNPSGIWINKDGTIESGYLYSDEESDDLSKWKKPTPKSPPFW